MTICYDCGQDHANQFTEYPTGATIIVTSDFWGAIDNTQYKPLEHPQGEGAPRVLISAGSLGHVIDHCDDGRVLIEFEAETGKTKCAHSFHHPETYFMVVLGEAKTV